MKSRMVVLSVGALAASIMVLAGCSDAGASSGAPASAGQTAHPWTPSPSSSASAAAATVDPLLAKYGPPPLDSFNPSKADSDATTSAYTALMSSCMKEKGFTYSPDVTQDSGTTTTQWASFLGLTDMARAKSYGYQTQDLTEAQAKKSEPGGDSSAPSVAHNGDHAYWQAVFGKSLFDPKSSDHGCDGKANAQLDSPKEGVDVSIQGELLQQATQTAQSNSAVRSALSSWSECMSQHGYKVSTPPMPTSTANVTKSDIDKAVADVTCKDSSGLTDTYITTLYQGEKDLIASHRSQLDAYSAWLKKNADKARQVLAQ